MDKKRLRVVITAGGGGHFAPALSVIQALPKDIDAFLIVRKYGLEGEKTISLEYKTVQKLKIRFVALTTGRLQRIWTRHSILSWLKMPVGLVQSLSILIRFRPHVVLSFGGYVSVPVVVAAYLLRIPIIIHEQTLGAGLANRLAAKFATKICISWQQSAQFFPKEKIVLTGNPMRSSLLHSSSLKSPLLQELDSEGKPLVYITGGSLGSHAINELVAGCLTDLLKNCAVIHQTGESAKYQDFEKLKALREKLDTNEEKRYVVTKFVDPEEVPSLLHHADVVIGRAGMSTVTELLFFGKPSILIPLPFAQGNEQLKNAEFLKSFGLAEILEQQKSTPETFLNTVMDVFSKREEMLRNAGKARASVPTNATEHIISLLYQVSK